MKVLTVKEAVEWVNSGHTLEGVALEEGSRQQVNVRDAMVLSRGGIVIPEYNIYYDDADIEYDEDIDDLTVTSGVVQLSWEEKVKKAAHQQKTELEEEGIAYDEAFEGNWQPIETDGLAEAEDRLLEVQLHLEPEIKAWLEQQATAPSQILENLLENFYRAQQLINKK